MEGTEYTIKVKVTDKAGNETEVSKKTATDGEKFSDIYETTTKYTDSEGNVAWIPGGFAVGVDEEINKISTGLVITDAINENHTSKGNQFVWIPVGTYNTSEGEKTNNLTRRSWGKENVVQEPVEISGDSVINSYYYGEGDSRSIAKDAIEAFKTNATNKGGFYIGRYEAGTEEERRSNGQTLTTPLVQKNKYPYVYITRDLANTQSQVMYTENSYVKSELMSSYAWDTALNFICQTNAAGYTLATTTSSIYGNIGTSTRKNTGKYETDKYSNIYDLLGNCYEWTTEYTIEYASSGNGRRCIVRGANSNVKNFAANRSSGFNTSSSSNGVSFRIQLYIK